MIDIGWAIDIVGIESTALVEHLDLDAIVTEIATDLHAVVARRIGVRFDRVGRCFGDGDA